MAFRRFKNSGRRFGNLRSRFRRPLRKIVQTARWEVARISLDAQRTMVNGPQGETVEYFHLASIATSFASTAAGSPEARVGAVWAGLNRRLEIGGLVFDYLHQHDGELAGDLLRGEGSYDVHMSLAVDRIGKDLASVPFPVSVGTFKPFFAGFPQSIFNTVTPIDSTEPADSPTRILWERNLFIDTRPKVIQNDAEGVLYVPQNQRLGASAGLVNRRLKLSLDESQGLYLIHATRNSNNFALLAAQRTFRFALRGKLYYRYQQ